MSTLIEACLGVGIGAIAIIVAMAPGNPKMWAQETLIGVPIIVLMMTVLIVGVQGYVLRPTIKQSTRWAFLSGSEAIAFWFTTFIGTFLFGVLPGVTVSASIVIGCLIAVFQQRLLQTQTARAELWLFGSVGTWIVAGGVAWIFELYVVDPFIGILFGVAVSRLIYGALSGGLLAWIIEGEILEGQEK
jgi:hypothetical protein